MAAAALSLVIKDLLVFIDFVVLEEKRECAVPTEPVSSSISESVSCRMSPILLREEC